MNKELGKVYWRAHAEIDGKRKEICVVNMIQPLHPISPIYHQSLLCKDREVFKNKSGEKYPKAFQNN